jgi:hypothetical protein
MKIETITPFVPLLNTTLILLAIFIFILIFRKSVSSIFEILIHRLRNGNAIKAGPVELSELKANLKNTNEEDNFLVDGRYKEKRGAPKQYLQE